jgi:hypothetical protein
MGQGEAYRILRALRALVRKRCGTWRMAWEFCWIGALEVLVAYGCCNELRLDISMQSRVFLHVSSIAHHP